MPVDRREEAHGDAPIQAARRKRQQRLREEQREMWTRDDFHRDLRRATGPVDQREPDRGAQ